MNKLLGTIANFFTNILHGISSWNESEKQRKLTQSNIVHMVGYVPWFAELYKNETYRELINHHCYIRTLIRKTDTTKVRFVPPFERRFKHELLFNLENESHNPEKEKFMIKTK